MRTRDFEHTENMWIHCHAIAIFVTHECLKFYWKFATAKWLLSCTKNSLAFFFLTQVFSFVGHFPSNRFFSRHTHLLEASNVCLSIEAIAPKKYDLNKLNNWLFYAWPNRLNHCAPKTDDNERKRKNGTRKHGKDCAPGRDKKVEVQCAFVHFMYFVVQSSYLMHSL